MLERVVGRIVVDRGRDKDGRVGRQAAGTVPLAAGERHELLRGGVQLLEQLLELPDVTLVLPDLVLPGLGRRRRPGDGGRRRRTGGRAEGPGERAVQVGELPQGRRALHAGHQARLRQPHPLQQPSCCISAAG